MKIDIKYLEERLKEGNIRGWVETGKGKEEKKKSKYGNKKVFFDNIWFDSKKEYQRYLELRMLEKAGEIKELRLQVPFDLDVNDKKVGRYLADFTYLKNGSLVVEDVKSGFTRRLPVYRLKKKLMASIHGIIISEV